MAELKPLFAELGKHLSAGDATAAETVLARIEAGGRGDHPGLAMYRVRLARLTGDDIALMRNAAEAYRTEPARAGSYLNYALALRRFGRQSEAETVLQDALCDDPDTAEPHLYLAAWAEEAGQGEAAMAQYGAALARAPDHRKARHRFIALALSEHRLTEAAEALKLFEKRFGNTLDAARLKVALCRAQGNLQAAVAPARKAFKLSESLRDATVLADLLTKVGRFPAALKLLKWDGFADADPEWLALRRADLLERNGRLKAALAEVDAFLERQPDHMTALMSRARLLVELGQSAQAEPLLRRLVLNDSARIATPAMRRLVDLLRRSDRPEVAAEALIEARRRHPTNGVFATMAASILFDLGRRAEARRMAADFHKRPTQDLGETLERARVLARLRDGKGECRVLNAALDNGLNDQRLMDYILRRAMPFAALPQIEDRMHRLEACYDKPLSERLWIQLYMSHAQYARAEAYLRARPQVRRSEAEARDMARLLIARHHTALADRYLRFCRRRWPDSADFVTLQLDFLIRDGQLEAAETALRAAPQGNRDLARKLFEVKVLLELYRRPGSWPKDIRQDRESLAELSPVVRQRLMRNTIARADLDLANTLGGLMSPDADSPDAPHWRSGLEGQVLTEMQLLAQEFGTAWPGPGLWSDDSKLVRETHARPWSTVLAAAQIQRWMGDQTSLIVPARPRKDWVIPQAIWQYWDDPDPPEAVSEMVTSWSGLPGWSHQLFNRAQARNFLKQEFGPDWLRAFGLARGPAEEADFMRLCILARRGGVWADADDRLHGDLNALLAGHAGLVVFREPIGSVIANNVIVAAPGHPAIRQAAVWVAEALLQRANETVWLQSGPGLLTRAVGQFLVTKGSAGARGGIRISGQEELRRQVAIHNRLPHKSTAHYWNRKRARDPGYVAIVDRLLAAKSADPADSA